MTRTSGGDTCGHRSGAWLAWPHTGSWRSPACLGPPGWRACGGSSACWWHMCSTSKKSRIDAAHQTCSGSCALVGSVLLCCRRPRTRDRSLGNCVAVALQTIHHARLSTVEVAAMSCLRLMKVDVCHTRNRCHEFHSEGKHEDNDLQRLVCSQQKQTEMSILTMALTGACSNLNDDRGGQTHLCCRVPRQPRQNYRHDLLPSSAWQAQRKHMCGCQRSEMLRAWKQLGRRF